MAATSTSSWSDKNEQKVFKCIAKAATKYPFSILVRLELIIIIYLLYKDCILECSMYQ